MAQPNDLHQILEIQSRERLARAEKRVQAQKEAEKAKRKRPDNVNRELFQLLGDLDPQMNQIEEIEKEQAAASGAQNNGKLKKIPKLDRPVDKWVWHHFSNTAREDGVLMYHWMKQKEVNDPYPFARFNKKAQIITYTNEEYKKVIQPMKSDWEKLEIDVLFDLCQRFNMKFIVIADRYADELQDRLNKQNVTKV